MYCVKCGTKAEKGQKLCLACGMRLISPEALLKLLRKADLEKKLSQMDQTIPEKNGKSETSLKRHMDRLHKAETEAGTLRKKKKEEKAEPIRKEIPRKTKKTTQGSEEKVKKTAVKREMPASDKGKSRVTPLYENPTQPKRRSIFDDMPLEADVAKKAKPRSVEKPSASEKKPAVKKPPVKKPASPRSNPVVRFPEKAKSVGESRKRAPEERRAKSQLIRIYEYEEMRRKTSAPKKSPSAKRPDRTKAAPRRNTAPVKGQASSKMRSSSGGAGAKPHKPKRDEENFAEKYLRSIISMMLLTGTVVLMLMWGYATDTGNRTMAQLGLGSRRGYILLGDDCMANGNYKRAVEHYYKALSKRVNYEAGIKLASAYRQAGEHEKETSALLLLMDRYEGVEEPYQRIMELYPDPYTRPEKVQTAINMHER